MDDNYIVGYVVLSIIVACMTAMWTWIRYDDRKTVWPVLTAAGMWFAPAALRLWFAMLLS